MLKREHILEKISSIECYDFVVKRLSDIEKLSTGVIAGQAVASAVVEFLEFDRLINPIYNDIDIFKHLSYEYFNKIEYTSDFFKKLIKKENLTSRGYFNSSYSDNYGQVFYGSAERSRVLGSFRKEKINKTYLMINSALVFDFDTAVYEVISEFDINSTQVGFYYNKSQKLIFTELFIDFLYTKELRITTWKTPVHSLLRLYKKKEEFGENVFSNLEESMNVSMVYINSLRGIKEYRKEIMEMNASFDFYTFRNKPLNFGEKYKDVFQSFLSDNKSIKLINSDNFYSLDYSDKITSKAFSFQFQQNILDFDKGMFFNTDSRQALLQDVVQGDFSNLELYRNEVKSNFLSVFGIILPNVYNSLKNTRKSTRLYVEKDDKKDGFILDILKHGDKVNSNDIQKWKKNSSIFKKHPRLKDLFFVSDLTVAEKNTIIENIRKVDKETEVLIGYIETNYNKVYPKKLLTIDGCREIANNYLKELNVPLTTRLVDFETNNYKIKQLISKKELIDEGNELGHCVGGYGANVKKGKSIIVQFVPKNKNGTRCTMELQPTIRDVNNPYLFKRKFSFVKNNYYIQQIYGKSNSKVVLDRGMYEAFEEISKKFSFLPISYIDSSIFKDIEDSIRPKFIEREKLNFLGKTFKFFVGNKYVYNAFKKIENKGFPGFSFKSRDKDVIFSLKFKRTKHFDFLQKIILKSQVSYKNNSRHYILFDEEYTYQDFLNKKSYKEEKIFLEVNEQPNEITGDMIPF